MIPDRDIWRAVNLLIREHRDDAVLVAAQRADEMFERGEHNGQLVWLRIRGANRRSELGPQTRCRVFASFIHKRKSRISGIV
jgi:hypothetical protein